MSAAHNQAALKQPPTTAPGNPANAPTVTLPLRFVITALLALPMGFCLLLLRPEILTTYHYNQHVIATTHLFVLGWICTVVMGAVYQLVPVALETHLYSERLAKWQFLFHAVGFVGMVWMFWRWDMKQVGHFGSVLTFGVVLFVYNIARTLARVPRWNVVGSSVASTLMWLCLTVTAGLAIAAAKCAYNADSSAAAGAAFSPAIDGLKVVARIVGRYDAIGAMHAHAHLGVVGVFVVLIVGVSYRLVPMFTLSELQSPRRAMASVLLLNLGLAGTFVTILLRSNARPVFAAVMLCGLSLYAFELRAILAARKRRRLEWALKIFLTGVALLFPLALLGLVMSWPSLPLTGFVGQLENAYGFLALLGAITLAIQGMLYKILPFIVWYARYSREIGRSKVPSLSELFSERLQIASFAVYCAGLATTTAAILCAHPLLARVGVVTLLIGTLLFLTNVIKMLSHLRNRRSTESSQTGLRTPQLQPARS
jgi:hypothetical protein